MDLNDIRNRFRRPTTSAALALVPEPESESKQAPIPESWTPGRTAPEVPAHSSDVFMMAWVAEGKAKRFKGWRLSAQKAVGLDIYDVTIRWGAVSAAGIVTDVNNTDWGQSQPLSLSRSELEAKITSEARTRAAHDYTLMAKSGIGPLVNLI